MKKKSHSSKWIFLLVSFCSFSSSCSHKYYAPNDGDILALNKKNDLHFSASMGSSALNLEKKSESANLQLGYSPIKHLAVSASYFSLRQQNRSSPRREGNGRIWNSAIGGYYFFKFKELPDSKLNAKQLLRKQKGLFSEEGILLDLYLGSGKGRVNNYYIEGGSSIFNFDKRYIQFGFHIVGRSLSFNWTFRLANLNYNEGIIFGRPNALNDLSFNILKEQNQFKLNESTLRLTFGQRKIRFMLSSTFVGGSENFELLGIKPIVSNFGLIIEIDDFFRKNNSEDVDKKVDF